MRQVPRACGVVFVPFGLVAHAAALAIAVVAHSNSLYQRPLFLRVLSSGYPLAAAAAASRSSHSAPAAPAGHRPRPAAIGGLKAQLRAVAVLVHAVVPELRRLRRDPGVSVVAIASDTAASSPLSSNTCAERRGFPPSSAGMSSRLDYISLGHYEQDDVAVVADYLSDALGVTRVGIWGRSMGAATALRSIRFTVGKDETEKFAARQEAAAADSMPHYTRVKKTIEETTGASVACATLRFVTEDEEAREPEHRATAAQLRQHDWLRPELHAPAAAQRTAGGVAIQPGQLRRGADVVPQRLGAAAWSKWPSWWGRSWPARSPPTASEGLRLPSALGRRAPAPQTPQRSRGSGAKPRPRRRFRCV